MQRSTRKARQGFTLIELLVVVVIIGILASIAMPSFVGAQDKARNAKVMGNINVVRVGVEGFSADNNGNPPDGEAVGTVGDGGLQQATYLPGGKFPPSPWAKESQSNLLDPSGDEVLPYASQLVEGDYTLPPPGTRFPDPVEGTVQDPPSDYTDYGALLYDVDGPSGTYVIYGMGKRNGEVVVGGAVSNNSVVGSPNVAAPS